MIIKNKDISVNDAIKYANYDDLLLRRRNNNILLSNYQIDILNKKGINYLNYNDIRNLLFDIEKELNNDYDEELDLVSSQISEFIYYNETKK